MKKLAFVMAIVILMTSVGFAVFADPITETEQLPATATYDFLAKIENDPSGAVSGISGITAVTAENDTVKLSLNANTFVQKWTDYFPFHKVNMQKGFDILVSADDYLNLSFKTDDAIAMFLSVKNGENYSSVYLAPYVAEYYENVSGNIFKTGKFSFSIKISDIMTKLGL